MTTVFAFIISFFSALLVTPIVIWLYRANGWVDDPKKSKHPKVVHTKPTPRGGGVVIALATIIPSILLLGINKQLIGILVAACFIAVIGFLDDLHDLSPKLRLPLLFLAALIVVGSGVGIAYISNPFGPGVIHLDQPRIVFEFFGSHAIWILADLFALVWIVWTMTIVNWSKGLDGQMPGFVGIAALVIGVLSLRFSSDPAQLQVTTLSLIISGAFFGFLLWNMFPQKIMAGYGAGSLAGFYLAILAILSGAKVATALLVLAIPTIDACFVIARRITNGKSPLWGDRGHLHHRLMDMGWGKRRIAAFYWLSTAILGLASLQLNSQQKLYTIVGAVVLFGGFVAWITLFFSSSRQLARDNG